MGLLLALITCGVAVAAGLLVGFSIYTRRRWLTRFALGGITVWIALYFALLIGSSLTSEEKELALNQPKEFCGFYLDCHMHTAVTSVRRTKTLGNKTADGEFYIVRVKVFSNAKRATIGFGGLKLYVIDADGRRYPHSPEAEPAESWFTRPVPAGESFERDVVFDLPADVGHPRLDIHDEQSFIEKFLIGDEDSIFHKRSYFTLETPDQTASIK